MNKLYYIYNLASSKTPNIPFYVGKGKNNRLHIHVLNSIDECAKDNSTNRHVVSSHCHNKTKIKKFKFCVQEII